MATPNHELPLDHLEVPAARRGVPPAAGGKYAMAEDVPGAGHKAYADNPEALLAQKIIEQTATSLFLTGNAGTGKTTFLRRLKARAAKRMIVLAPTGIAAINAGGVTIHSFFQLSPAPFIPEATPSAGMFRFSKQKVRLIRSLDLIVIDEISMVRADVLDSIDATLRRFRDPLRPFGGVQLLLIGDLQQLAPVSTPEEWTLLSQYYKSPYFFSSRALKQTDYAVVELHHIYRQSDDRFVGLLNAVRHGTLTDDDLEALNSRYVANFIPRPEEGYIRLVTHNRQAREINDAEMDRLAAAPFTYDATVAGNFPASSFPTDASLRLKRGAQVMFVKNDPERRFFNGSLGEVVSLNADGFSVRLYERGEHAVINVEPAEWTNSRYVLNAETKVIEETVEGRFRQFPVRPAWAITVHKSQGLTFAHAIIDVHSAFSHGQAYVALSRCRTLEGMVLAAPISRSAIITDDVVDAFTAVAHKREPDSVAVGKMARQFFVDTLVGLIDFSEVRRRFLALQHHVTRDFGYAYPRAVEEMDKRLAAFGRDVTAVSEKYAAELRQAFAADDTLTAGGTMATDTPLGSRLSKACRYFAAHCGDLMAAFGGFTLPSDNKVLVRRTMTLRDDFVAALRLKGKLLAHVAAGGFALSDFLHYRAVAGMDDTAEAEKGKTATAPRKAGAGGKTQERIVVPSDIAHPDLFRALTEWRAGEAHKKNLPSYVILQQRALLGIANLLPDTPEALAEIPYFGKKGLEKYGEALLGIVRQYMAAHHLERPVIRREVVEKVPADRQETTQAASYRLFRAGKTVEQIAAERQLTADTVFGHLAKYVAAGRLTLSALVPPDKINRIRTYLKERGGRMPTYQDFKSSLGGGDLTFKELRLVHDADSAADGNEENAL